MNPRPLNVPQPLSSGLRETPLKPATEKDRPDSTKSPLRYPGGKSFAVNKIREYIPDEIHTLVSPFLGGGSVELSCAADGMRVYGSDAFELLMNFWIHAQKDPEGLSNLVRVYLPLTRSKFYSLQKGILSMENGLERAAVFFVLNRSSFSGVTLSGGMSPGHPRFTESAIDRLRDFRSSNLIVNCCDYKDTLANHPDEVAYLDPPYANGEKLYGHRGDMHEFDHGELYEVLSQRKGWILSYNDDPRIRQMYRNYRIECPRWSYSMSNGSKSKELLIVNL